MLTEGGGGFFGFGGGWTLVGKATKRRHEAILIPLEPLTTNEASLLKIRGSEIQQRVTELMFEAVGHYAFPHVPGAMEEGSNEPPIGPDYAAIAAE